MPQPEAPAARSGAIQGSAYSESASNGASMPTPARSLFPKLTFFISLLGRIISPRLASWLSLTRSHCVIPGCRVLACLDLSKNCCAFARPGRGVRYPASLVDESSSPCTRSCCPTLPATRPKSSAIRVTAVREGVHVAVSVARRGRGRAGRAVAPPVQEVLPDWRRRVGEESGTAGAGPGPGPGPRHLRGDSGDPRGRIWAESDGPGLGTRSPFTLPAVEEAATLPTQLPVRSGRVGRQRTRILVVDDDPQTLRYVRDALTEAGYAVVATGDPEEALGIVAAGDVPVIFLSAYGREELIVRAFDMGAEDYVVKLFSPTELATRIRAALRRRAVSEQPAPLSSVLQTLQQLCDLIGAVHVGFPLADHTVFIDDNCGPFLV